MCYTSVFTLHLLVAFSLLSSFFSMFISFLILFTEKRAFYAKLELITRIYYDVAHFCSYFQLLLLLLFFLFFLFLLFFLFCVCHCFSFRKGIEWTIQICYFISSPLKGTACFWLFTIFPVSKKIIYRVFSPPLASMPLEGSDVCACASEGSMCEDYDWVDANKIHVVDDDNDYLYQY